MSTHDTEVPYLDISDVNFGMQTEEVRNARERTWYARTNYGIAVLRYEEVSQLLKSPKLHQGSAMWPEHNGVHEGAFYDWWKKNLLVLEGQEHHRIRRLLVPAFSPTLAKRLEPQFVELANELIDGFIDKGEFDFVTEFADPYATRVICILLNIPQDQWPVLAEYGSTIGLALGINIKEDLPKIDNAVVKLYEYADALIQERKREPGQDPVTKLVEFSEKGDRLTDAELRNGLVLMIFGGMDTTRNQLGLGMQTFLHNPEQWELLARNPELASNAVEEVMRLNPTATWVTREAAEDFEFKGLEITKGTTVHLFSKVAGTDPEAFPNPEMDLLAERQPHFGFGGGTHHCIGHYVARADMSIAMTALSQRLTDIRCEGGDEWLPDSGNTGAVRLPVTFRCR